MVSPREYRVRRGAVIHLLSSGFVVGCYEIQAVLLVQIWKLVCGAGLPVLMTMLLWLFPSLTGSMYSCGCFLYEAYERF